MTCFKMARDSELAQLKADWPSRKFEDAVAKTCADPVQNIIARHLWGQMHRESFRRTIKRIQAEQTGKIAVSQ